MNQRPALDDSVLKRLVHQLPHMVWMKDTSGRYLACNAKFEAFFNATEAEILGKTDADFVNSELAAACHRHDANAMASATPLVNEEWIVMPDGSNVLLETTKTAVRDEHGQLLGVLGVGYEITQRKQAEERMRISLSRYQALLSTTPDGFWEFNRDGLIIDVNDTYCMQSGYQREQLLGMRIWELDVIESAAEVRNHIRALEQMGSQVFESVHRRQDASHWAVEISVNYSKLNGEHFFAFLRDISDRKQNEQLIQDMAYTDLLTGLPNRAQLDRVLSQEIAAANTNMHTTAVAFIDLDGLKAINDSLGHVVGDQLIIAASQRMRGKLRGNNTLSRLGGDEFVAIMPALSARADAFAGVTRLLSVLAQPFDIHGHKIHISASIGVTFLPQAEPVDALRLIRQADQAMYEAKQAGRDCFRVYQPSHHEHADRRQRWAAELHSALQQQQLELHYQPKVNMRSGQVIGLEALLRWNHPQQGRLYPDDFLPDIDTHSIIAELGDWTIEQALTQLAQWQALGIELPVSVNIASLHLLQPDFADKLAGHLQRYNTVPAALLELEIIDSTALSRRAQVSDSILRCHQLGVRFSLDDFGADFSAVSELKLLPIDTLKIDRAFTAQMMSNTRYLSILEGALKLANAFDRRFVAEGVETPEQGEFLLLLGCEHAQGYGIARPMPAEQVQDWLEAYQPASGWLNASTLHDHSAPAIMALVSHTAWALQFEQAVRHQRPLPEMSSGQCPLEQWLHHAGQHGHDSRELEPLKALHQQAHALAEQLASAGDSYSEEQSTALMTELLQHNLLLQGALRQLAEFSQPALHKCHPEPSK